MSAFIIHWDDLPIAYIQSYAVQAYPWEGQDLSEEVVQEAAGIDLFIGEEKETGRGLGALLLDHFLDQCIWPYYRYCLVDPDISNHVSIRLFEKCGFVKHQQITHQNALEQAVVLQLMIRDPRRSLVRPP